MRILYGVMGEGRGHASRSSVAIEHLRRSGHDVAIAASDAAYRFLSPRFPDVVPIDGFALRYQEGALDFPASALENAARLVPMEWRNAEVAAEIDRRYAPEAVVTDLDPFAWRYARLRGLPLVSLDNHLGITRATPSPAVARREAASIALVGAFVAALVPNADRYLATSFVAAAPRPECAGDTRILPPVLRESVLRAAYTAAASSMRYQEPPGEVVVYQTNKSDASRVLAALKALPDTKFVAYGLGHEGPDVQTGNVRVAGFSEDGFLRDLRSAPCVIANAGYSLLSECVALGKPVLSIPVASHPEQSFNSSLLEQAGFGMRAERPEPAVIREFLRRAPAFRATLASAPRHDENRALYAELDALFPSL